MISIGALLIAIFAAAIPVSWFFIVRWFLSKDIADTEQLDQFELCELTDQYKSAEASSNVKRENSHSPDLTRAGAH